MKKVLLLLAFFCGLANAQYYGPIYNPAAVAITGGTITGTTITNNITGNASGTAATVTTAAQPAITSLGSLTGLTVNGVSTITAAGSTTGVGLFYTSSTGTTTGSNVVLDVESQASARDAHIRFADGVSASARLGYLSGNLYLWTNGVENMRLSAGGKILIGTTTDDTVNKLQVTGNAVITGHVISGGTVPTVVTNDCGSSTQGTITAGGNDNAFLVTVGTAAVTSCAVSFAATWGAAPKACLIFPANAGAAALTVLAYVSAISTTKVTISGSALASTAFYVHCF